MDYWVLNVGSRGWAGGVAFWGLHLSLVLSLCFPAAVSGHLCPTCPSAMTFLPWRKPTVAGAHLCWPVPMVLLERITVLSCLETFALHTWGHGPRWGVAVSRSAITKVKSSREDDQVAWGLEMSKCRCHPEGRRPRGPGETWSGCEST